MANFILLTIVLINASFVFSQEYRIVHRSRDGEFALLKDNKVIIPYHTGRMFFLRGQGEEITELGTLNRYYPLLNQIDLNEVYLAVYNENGQAAIYDLEGNQLSNYIYDFKFDVREINKQMIKFGFTRVLVDDQYQDFITYEGNLLFPPVYKLIVFSFEKYGKINSTKYYVWFRKGDVLGIKDFFGKELYTFKDLYKVEDIYTGETYPDLNQNKEFTLLTFALRNINNKIKLGLINIDLKDTTSKVLLKNKFDSIENVGKNSGGILLLAKKDGQAFYLNSKLEKINITPNGWIRNLNFYGGNNNNYLIFTNNNYGILNKNGEVILEPKYDKPEFGGLMIDYVIIKKKNKYGVFDIKTGRNTGLKYDYVTFDNKGGNFASITIEIYAQSNYENDKIGKLTKGLEEVWSNWKNGDINIKNRSNLPVNKGNDQTNQKKSSDNNHSEFIENPDKLPIMKNPNEFYRRIGELYPEIAKRAGVQGKVTALTFIDEQGNVVLAQIQKGIGAGCDEFVLNVLMKTKFQPGQSNGVPVKVKMLIPVEFKLR